MNAEHAAEREHLSTGFEAQVRALEEEQQVSSLALKAAEEEGERARGELAAALEEGARLEHLSAGFEAQVLTIKEELAEAQQVLSLALEEGGRARAAVIQRALDAEVIPRNGVDNCWGATISTTQTGFSSDCSRREWILLVMAVNCAESTQ